MSMNKAEKLVRIEYWVLWSCLLRAVRLHARGHFLILNRIIFNNIYLNIKSFALFSISRLSQILRGNRKLPMICCNLKKQNKKTFECSWKWRKVNFHFLFELEAKSISISYTNHLSVGGRDEHQTCIKPIFGMLLAEWNTVTLPLKKVANDSGKVPRSICI